MNDLFVVSDEEGGFVLVKRGEVGFFDIQAKIRDEKAAALINSDFGHSPAEVRAAKLCSIFGIWDKFDVVVKDLEVSDEA